MKTKITAVFVLIILLTVCLPLFSACDEDNHPTPEPMPTVQPELYPSIDFIQPWLIQHWDSAKYLEHLDLLKEAGYDSVILQYTRTGASDNTVTFYPSEIAEIYTDGVVYSAEESTDCIGKLLTAADEKDMKVYIGLSVEDEWWTKSPTNTEWYNKRVELDNYMIDEISENYGSHPSFYGWYWAYETYNANSIMSNLWSNMMNQTIAHLNEIGDTKPLMISPYISFFLRKDDSYVYFDFWKNLISKINFRSGDIFAPQDSIGNICGDATVDEDALALTENAVKMWADAVKEKQGLKYYVNCEFFYIKRATADNDQMLLTAPLLRCLKQCDIARNYAEKIVTFSYSHYCVPDAGANRGECALNFHNDYLSYLEARELGTAEPYTLPTTN